MWWFVRRGEAETRERLSIDGRTAEDQLLEHVPDMSRINEHDIAVKVWMPELVAQTLKWVTDYEGVSQSSWVREHLTAYIYGHAALLAHRIRAKQAGYDDIRFSLVDRSKDPGRWIYKVPQLGKKTVAFKVWMSEQMHRDLLALATHAGIERSPFLREVLVGELFGRGSLPERPEILGTPCAEASAWERGDEVPNAVVEEADFDNLGYAERVWLDTGKA